MTSKKLPRPWKERARQPEEKARGHHYWTTKRDGEVRLRQDASSPYETPLTVHDMVMDTATKYANYIALGSKHRRGWHLLTYIELYEECRRAAKAFLQLGLQRFHGVGIMGFNSEEWVIASIGAIMAGGFSVGVSSTSSPKVCQVIAESSEMNVFVVDDDRQLQKVIQIQGCLKHLKAIVQYKEKIQSQLQNLYSWRAFLELADSIPDDELNRIIDSQKPNQCCALIYRLVATGPPKAIMLSHDNITWTTWATAQSLPYKHPPEGQEVLVSYLPLSYMGAQIFDMWVTISVAGALYFAQPGALRGSLVDTLREVKPTTFYGVPWIWERLLDNLKTSQLACTAFRRAVNKWAMGLGLKTNRRRMLGQVYQPPCFGLARKLAFNRARRVLGLHRCLQLFNMGLGLPQATRDYFLSLDMPVFELYGLSESSGVHTLSGQQDFRLFSCGKSLPGTHTKVEKQEDSGGIHIWGRNVFMGYLADEAATREKVDCHGWLHTGDLGFLDPEEFLYVLGNARDVITLSSGEKIHPNPIEERVKKHVPIVHYAVLVGQGAPYLCVLLTLKCQVNTDTGQPRDMLTSEAIAFCRQLRSPSTRLSDIIDEGDPAVMEFIGRGIVRANAEAASDSARIAKWALLETDFSVAGGELGATTKLKRAVVARMYQAEIERFYKDNDD